jgi:hypothetical protein
MIFFLLQWRLYGGLVHSQAKSGGGHQACFVAKAHRTTECSYQGKRVKAP